MKTYTLLMVALFCLTSCTSFSNSMVRDDVTFLTQKNIAAIDGLYESKGFEYINSGNIKSSEVMGFAAMLKVNNAVRGHYDKVEVRSKALDKTNTYEITFRLLDNDSVIYAFTYPAHLKNGLLRLGNYTSTCRGVPYLFGGCITFQSRIGLTGQKDLLVQNYHDNSGALLLMMWSCYTGNNVEKYKRIP